MVQYYGYRPIIHPPQPQLSRCFQGGPGMAWGPRTAARAARPGGAGGSRGLIPKLWCLQLAAMINGGNFLGNNR